MQTGSSRCGLRTDESIPSSFLVFKASPTTTLKEGFILGKGAEEEVVLQAPVRSIENARKAPVSSRVLWVEGCEGSR